jgi:hypothetical protein
MKIIKNITNSLMMMLVAGFVFSSCQKMDRPSLGDFPRDANPPGGALKFYAAFDGTTSDPLMNAVDSIRANFPSNNPLASTDGVRGKAVKGESQKFIRYVKPNDWAIHAKSFTVSFWYKKDGQTKNNTGGNGPEYIMSFKSNNGHWSGANMFVFLEGNNTAGQVKVMIADRDVRDNWFTWEGGQSIPGLLNNAWHHIALVYNASTSGMTLYVDGVANPNVKTWANQGDIKINNNAISEFRIGAGPQDNFNSDDWLSSSFKGEIDQFRLYSEALTAAEVAALFTGKL